jgi:hypothetical protein
MDARRVVLAATWVGVGVVVGGLVTVQRGAAAAGRGETIRARAIELVDEHGQVRGQLNVEPDGEAVLRLRDSKGEVRVKLGANSSGSGLVLLDGATEPAVQVLARTGAPTMTLTGKRGQRRTITP